MAFIPAALTLLEEALVVGSKVGPVLGPIFETITGAAAVSSAVRSAATSAPVVPSTTATPGATDESLGVRLANADIDPNVIHAIASAPQLPAPPPSLDGSIRGRPRLTRQYFEQKNGGDYLLPDQQTALFNQELSLIASFFGSTPARIGGIPEFASLASNAVLGRGPTFTFRSGTDLSRDMSYVLKSEQTLADLAQSSPALASAVEQARSDYELKLGGVVPSASWFEVLARRGISRQRIEAAWNRINGPGGDNPSTRAVFRRWMTDRLLPGAAGSAVTFLLEKFMNTPSGPQASVAAAPQEINNRTVSVDDTYVDFDVARDSLLAKEVSDAIRAITLGDEASSVIGSQSWRSQLVPLPGSVHWTPNTYDDSGLNDARPLPVRIPAAGPDIITYPGDAIYNRGLSGDFMTETLDDPSAHRSSTGLRLDMPPIPKRTKLAPYLIVPDDQPPNGYTGVYHMHNVRPYFPAIHETAQHLDHMVSQTYDPSMVATVPSFVSPVTSSAGNLYGRDQRGYKNTLESAPNVVGAGFDVSDTERRLVDNSTMEDSSAPYPSAYFQNDQQTQRERLSVSREIPTSNMSNPVFANVGAQRPVGPISTVQPL